MRVGRTHRLRRCSHSVRAVTAVLAVAVTAVTLVLAGPAAGVDDTTPPTAFDFVPDAGQFQAGYQVASPYSNIYVTWQPSSDDLSSVRYELSVDGTIVRVVTGEGGDVDITRRIAVSEGPHVVAVAALDTAGNRTEATHTLDVVVDKVDPWFTSTPRLMLWPGPVTDAGYPMRYSWTGADTGTGLAAVHIGPNHSCCYTVSPTLTNYDFAVPPGSELAWRLRIIDRVGREARVPRSGYVTPVAWRHTHRSHGWHTSTDSQALGGSEFRSSARGERFSVTATGKSVGWVASTGPNRGRADVLVDGERVATVNLFADQRSPAQVVWSAPLARAEAQKITIVNRSRAHRPTITVDALLVHR